MKFSERISFIYSLCEGDVIWDVCCDHSHIALLNLKEKKFQKVYCVDKSKESLDKIKANPFYLYYSQKYKTIPIEAVHQDGRQLDWSKTFGTLIIAGVGSHTLLKIIESCPENKRKQLTWILNPFNYPDKTKAILKNLFNDNKLQEHSLVEADRQRFIFKISAGSAS